MSTDALPSTAILLLDVSCQTFLAFQVSLSLCTSYFRILATHLSEAAGDMEEEEYAWLPAESLKPFTSGDSSSNVGETASSNLTLLACVEAASRAVLEREKLEMAQEKQAVPKEINGDQTDSDGGKSNIRSKIQNKRAKLSRAIYLFLSEVSVLQASISCCTASQYFR